MSSGDVAAWAGVILSLLAGGAAVWAFYSGGRREVRRALTDLHDSLTSGETAAARNTIGTLLYGDPGSAPDRVEAISAYFALIWALQRARNVFRTYRLTWQTLEVSASAKSVSQDVTDALTWNLSEIAENVVMFHDQYQEQWSVADRDAWDDIGAYVHAAELRKQISAKNSAARSLAMSPGASELEPNSETAISHRAG